MNALLLLAHGNNLHKMKGILLSSNEFSPPPIITIFYEQWDSPRNGLRLASVSVSPLISVAIISTGLLLSLASSIITCSTSLNRDKKRIHFQPLTMRSSKLASETENSV